MLELENLITSLYDCDPSTGLDAEVDLQVRLDPADCSPAKSSKKLDISGPGQACVGGGVGWGVIFWISCYCPGEGEGYRKHPQDFQKRAGAPA